MVGLCHSDLGGLATSYREAVCPVRVCQSGLDGQEHV